ncbi:hypothetical protein D9C73_009890 [Collichthys lucidus]|uniref:Uncharacterized protein n=1 Tax=Collichthys lucidus TaxID=240159 RepID=A0A4U5UMF8_COLLU|nr:hypothetical protein D9C73_009890 [Collichthys lucidus]
MDLIICVLGLLALIVEGIRCQGVYAIIVDILILLIALSDVHTYSGESITTTQTHQTDVRSEAADSRCERAVHAAACKRHRQTYIKMGFTKLRVKRLMNSKLLSRADIVLHAVCVLHASAESATQSKAYSFNWQTSNGSLFSPSQPPSLFSAVASEESPLTCNDMTVQIHGGHRETYSWECTHSTHSFTVNNCGFFGDNYCGRTGRNRLFSHGAAEAVCKYQEFNTTCLK